MTTAHLDDLLRMPGSFLVARLNKGFPGPVLQAVASKLAVSVQALSEALGISVRARQSRLHKLSGNDAERVFRAYRVFRRAAEVLGSEQMASTWLQTAQRMLAEKKPLELLRRDVGADEVLDVLGGIEDSGYL